MLDLPGLGIYSCFNAPKVISVCFHFVFHCYASVQFVYIQPIRLLLVISDYPYFLCLIFMVPKLKYARFPLHLLAFALFFFCGCSPNNDDQSPPPATIITSPATGITANAAILGGDITNEGGNTITERGIFYGTSPNPSVNNGKIVMGSGTGSFSATVSGLLPNTLYYVRAFALSSAGLIFGNQQSFTTLSKPQGDSAVAIYIGGWDTLYAYTADSGNVKWKKPLGGKAFSSPVYANGKVFIGCTDGKLYAFDSLGNSLWTFTTTSYIGSQSPVIKNGLVYICSEQSRDIYAINAETGTQAWHLDATEPGATVFGASDLTIYDNILYINSMFLYAIDATTGVLKWKYLNGGEVTPVKYNNKLYFTSRVYSLVVLDAVSGTFLWENLV
jgi:outer membrane protein assembly factor BamB